MDYDPIKDFLGRIFNVHPIMQRVFFSLLDLFFLRAWHVKKEVRTQFKTFPQTEPIAVLDAGTGFAQYAYFISKRYPAAKILAVDIKEDYLENARRFFEKEGLLERVTFAYEDLTALQAEGPFHFILSVDVMEHIEEDRKVFKNFAKVLHKGGKVLINTPSDLGGSDVQSGSEESFIGEHVRDGYNIDELKAKLADAGLQTTVARYTYGTFGSIAWRLLIKYPMKLLSLSKVLIVVLPVYYVPVLPIGMLLNTLDLHLPNKKGTGVLVVAEKES